jgi:hypothetical protein
MFVPQSHGGLELDLPAALEVIGALGRIDGSVGWTAMIGAGSRKVMCGCPRRCKRSFDGAGDDRVRSCVRPGNAALSHAAGRYGDVQTRRRSKKRALSSLTLIAFPGLDLSDQFALTVPRPPSSPTHQRKRLPIRPAPALILDILRPC